jgi:hypothetical protein
VNASVSIYYGELSPRNFEISVWTGEPNKGGSEKHMIVRKYVKSTPIHRGSIGASP